MILAQPRRTYISFVCCVIAISCFVRSHVYGEDFSAEQLRFFERRIRPVLVEHCYECHSAANSEGGLRLDSRAAVLRGGDQGPALVPGNVSRSLLLKAVSYDDEDLAMPPNGKLSSQEIADLKRWISQQAAWPNEIATPETPNSASAAAQDHWAFQPITNPVLPEVNNVEWIRNEIDTFVLAKLQSHGLGPSPRAETKSLVRRAFLDLTGLPPTHAQRLKLEKQPFGEVVDRLLSEPSYGERWGRHWLDVARYADTKGYVDGGQRRFAFAYTYRDYVVRAFNEDLPFDEMVIDQLAADLHDYDETEHWRMAGMGFLTVGRRFNHNYYDTIDDQIDVISRGLQGLTISCARCHDHKFDPISTADYYSLYGILANSEEPPHSELPILGSDLSAEHQCELHNRSWRYEKRFNELHRQIERELRNFAGDYLLYLVRESAQHRDGTQNGLKTPRTILRAASAYGFGAIRRWRNYIAACPDQDPVFGLWHAMDAVPKDRFGQQLAREWKRPYVNVVLSAKLTETKPISMIALARSYGELLESVAAEWQQCQTEDPKRAAFRNPAMEQLRQVLYGDHSPARITPFESIDCYTLDEHVELRNLAGKVEEYSVQATDIAPRAMVMRQSDVFYQPTVFRRGHPNRPGDWVPLRVPRAFSAFSSNSNSNGPEDRRALAQAIIHPANPLTARVIVNRIWAWHFGQPLVATVSDFGVRSTPPTHRALLDYLAHWFRKHGWSVKKLHRLIMNSATYQQASHAREQAQTIDPENQLLWRFRPRRLTWEAIRDSLLMVSGRLSNEFGGPSRRQSPSDPDSVCRTVYLAVDRQEIPKFAEYFDFPAPDFSSPLRPITTVPQQQLFFLNSPFVLKQADDLGKWAVRLRCSQTDRFRALHRRIFADDTDMLDQEIAETVAAFQTANTEAEKRWSIIAHAMLQSNRFIMIE